MSDARRGLSADIAARTDSYFNRTKRIVARFGDKTVTYAIFLRRPVVCAPRLMLEWLQAAAAEQQTDVGRRPDATRRATGSAPASRSST